MLRSFFSLQSLMQRRSRRAPESSTQHDSGSPSSTVAAPRAEAFPASHAVPARSARSSARSSSTEGSKVRPGKRSTPENDGEDDFSEVQQGAVRRRLPSAGNQALRAPASAAAQPPKPGLVRTNWAMFPPGEYAPCCTVVC
jgi:hypothetical protein